MSVVAWRLFTITLMARTNPDTPCTEFLTENEWKVLFLKVNKNKEIPEATPVMGDVVIWIQCCPKRFKNTPKSTFS
jgi:hypothetical protein